MKHKCNTKKYNKILYNYFALRQNEILLEKEEKENKAINILWSLEVIIQRPEKEVGGKKGEELFKIWCITKPFGSTWVNGDERSHQACVGWFALILYSLQGGKF